MKIKNKKIIILIIVFLLMIIFIYQLDFTPKKIDYGVSFSPLQAERLGLDWKKAYLSIFDDLKVSRLRLSAYWNTIEAEQNIFNWQDLDWQMEEAKKREVKVVLVIGRRVPRWPECHDPSWLNDLSKEEQEEKVLNLIKEEIEHFKKYDNIVAWQVENERLFSSFGACAKSSRAFLKREIDFVKSLDNRPTITTDSGELSFWLGTSGLSDILGTTIYSKVYNRYLGYFRHIYPPFWYYLRTVMARRIFGNQKVIASELQAEPWEAGQPLKEMSLESQNKAFNLKDFRDNLFLAEKSGFDEIYFWGAEWWYWLKERGDDSFWLEAKNIFSK
ncbi:MAG: hypothetical protein Athens101410_262 [Parcubacteria group bacterium Athens1014_10]|nr:MAG: hypothetical protein Athens101410_262 [Parcubacteria group bacterium Athens1014_10]TSD04999.1 MAG: hypothetical protein Athens071412_541 [Parcubacteria group bacterium Athens0714_12]